jgi:hypothetical protein
MIISGCFQLTEDVVVYVGLRAHNYGWTYLRGTVSSVHLYKCTYVEDSTAVGQSLGQRDSY